MTQLSKTNFKALYGSSGSQFADNSTGDISEADVRGFGETIADSFVSITDGTSAASADYTKGSILTNSADSSEKFIRFLWYAGSSSAGNQDLTGTSLMPEDSVLTITIHGQGVAADGSAGISVVKSAGYRRDGSGTPVQIGSTSSLHSVEDSGDTPTITLSINSGDPRVAFDSNSVTVYHWTIWAEIAITKV